MENEGTQESSHWRFNYRRNPKPCASCFASTERFRSPAYAEKRHGITECFEIAPVCAPRPFSRDAVVVLWSRRRSAGQHGGRHPAKGGSHAVGELSDLLGETLERLLLLLS